MSNDGRQTHEEGAPACESCGIDGTAWDYLLDGLGVCIDCYIASSGGPPAQKRRK